MSVRVPILALVLGTALLAGVPVAAQERSCGPVPLRAPIAETERTEILVLATPHLRRLESLDRSKLEGLLEALERWSPDVIGVEVLPAGDVVAMEALPGFGPVLDAFAGPAREIGAVAREASGLGWTEAAVEADSLLKALRVAPPGGRASIRARLVPRLAAAYRPHSAALQWAYLEEEDPATAATIPDTLRTLLRARLDAPSEEAAIGLALARRLGHEVVHPIDDHSDKDAYLRMAGALTAELEATQAYRELAESGALEASARRLAAAHAAGDLLPHYLELNAPDAQAADVDLQWAFFFRTRLPSGLDRTRVAMWEERNHGIAAHVRRITAPIPGGRALVVIGASHKPFLDAYLACGMDVTVVDLADIVEKSGGGSPE